MEEEEREEEGRERFGFEVGQVGWTSLRRRTLSHSLTPRPSLRELPCSPHRSKVGRTKGPNADFLLLGQQDLSKVYLPSRSTDRSASPALDLVSNHPLSIQLLHKVCNRVLCYTP